MSTFALKIAYLILWVSSAVIRYPHEKRNKRNRIVTNNKTALEKVLLVVVFIGMGILPLVYVFTSWLNFANYSLPLWAEILGIVLIVPSLWLFYRSHKDLGKNWSVSLELREDHNIVDTGVYKHIRHPMYTAIWIWVIVQSMLIQNYIAGLSGLISFGVLYFLRINKEEEMMEEQFGFAYKNYKSRTHRLIPKIH